MPELRPALRAFCFLLALVTAFAASGQEDAADIPLQGQLSAVYENIDGLEPVDVSVTAGVVTLQGEVVSEDLRERAGALARGFEGVVEVQNELVVSTDVAERVGPALRRLEERALRVLYHLPLIVVGLLVFGLAWWFAGWLSSREWIVRRAKDNPFMRNLIRQGVRAAIVLAAALFVLDLLDLTALVGAVLGAAGLATLAIGFAFRDLIENFIASVMLSLRQPFEPNDLIRIGDHEGRVSRLTSRATVLITPEGNHVRIPNATVFKAEMVNYSRNPRRRFGFDVGVDVELALSPVQALAERVVGAVDGVLQEPAPFCLVTQLGDSSVLLRIHGWVDQTRHDFGRVRSEAIRQVKEAFDEANIGMPEPTYNVKMIERSGVQPAHPVMKRTDDESLEAVPGEVPRGQDTRHRDETEPVVAREASEGENLLDETARRE